MKRLSSGSAHRGVAVLSVSSAAGQLLTLAAAPVLSRIYSPEAFGVFAILLSIVSIAATAGSLRLESAIPVASEVEAYSLVKTALISSLVVGLCCVPLAFLFQSASVGMSPIAISLILPFLVWITAIYAVLTNYSLRGRSYAAVARRNFLQQAGTASAQFLVSAWIRSGLGLALGLGVGRCVGIASLVRETDLLSRHAPHQATPWLATLGRYWRFPLVFMPSALMNVVGTQIPILLVAAKYGTSSVGNLSQAIKFGAIPAALVGSAVSSVVMAEIAMRVRRGETDNRSRYLRVSKALIPMAVAWFLLLVVVAPVALPLILGDAWGSSGEFAAALAISAATGLIAAPLSVVFVLYEKSLVNISLDVARVVLVSVLGFTAWGLGYSAVAAVLAMSSAMAVIYAATWAGGLRVVSPAAQHDSCMKSEEGT